MTQEQFREFVDAVDECRRVQALTPWPRNMHQQRALTEAEKKVDILLERYRVPEPEVGIKTESSWGNSLGTS